MLLLLGKFRMEGNSDLLKVKAPSTIWSGERMSYSDRNLILDRSPLYDRHLQ